MDKMEKMGKWPENVMIVDANYIDKVAFDLTVNFERMIGRRIEKADLAHWIDCVALDGGMREGNNKTAVVLLHDKHFEAFNHFSPSNIPNQLHEKAFKDQLGEFGLQAVAIEIKMVDRNDFVIDVVQTICNVEEVKRIMIVIDTDNGTHELHQALKHVDEDKLITVFTMVPSMGGNFKMELLGYSLMSALGIKSDEITDKTEI